LTDILQEVQELDSRRLVQSYCMMKLLHPMTVWNIWKIDCPEKRRWTG